MQQNLNELLTEAKDLLKPEMTAISFETWIRNLEINSLENNNIVLVAFSPAQKDAIESRYKDLIINTFSFITKKQYSISIILDSEKDNQSKGEIPQFSPLRIFKFFIKSKVYF